MQKPDRGQVVEFEGNSYFVLKPMRKWMKVVKTDFSKSGKLRMGIASYQIREPTDEERKQFKECLKGPPIGSIIQFKSQKWEVLDTGEGKIIAQAVDGPSVVEIRSLSYQIIEKAGEEKQKEMEDKTSIPPDQSLIIFDNKIYRVFHPKENGEIIITNSFSGAKIPDTGPFPKHELIEETDDPIVDINQKNLNRDVLFSSNYYEIEPTLGSVLQEDPTLWPEPRRIYFDYVDVNISQDNKIPGHSPYCVYGPMAIIWIPNLPSKHILLSGRRLDLETGNQIEGLLEMMRGQFLEDIDIDKLGEYLEFQVLKKRVESKSEWAEFLLGEKGEEVDKDNIGLEAFRAALDVSEEDLHERIQSAKEIGERLRLACEKIKSSFKNWPPKVGTVDFNYYDEVQRLVFEHPEVKDDPTTGLSKYRVEEILEETDSDKLLADACGYKDLYKSVLKRSELPNQAIDALIEEGRLEVLERQDIDLSINQLEVLSKRVVEREDLNWEEKHLVRDKEINPTLRKRLFEKGSKQIAKVIVYRSDLTQEEAELLLDRFINEERILKRLSHINYNRILNRIIKSEQIQDHPYCAEGIAKNEYADPDTLEIIYDKFSDHPRRKEIYTNLTKNPSCSGELLKKLGRSRYKKVKMAVAENPSTPLDILEHLASLKGEYADVARSQLNERNSD